MSEEQADYLIDFIERFKNRRKDSDLEKIRCIILVAKEKLRERKNYNAKIENTSE